MTEVAELNKQRLVRQRKINLAREKLLNEVLTDNEYLTVKNQLEEEIRKIDKQREQKEREADACSVDVAQRVIEQLAMLKLGEQKLSEDQRRQLFRALVKRITPQDESLRVCEIELYANLPPQLVEGERRIRPDNLSPRCCTLPVRSRCQIGPTQWRDPAR